jgi:hypothetical protein
LLKVKSGTANLCLEPQAAEALAKAGISMSAGAPAQLVTAGPQPCVTTHVTEGTVSLGLTASFPSTARSLHPVHGRRPHRVERYQGDVWCAESPGRRRRREQADMVTMLEFTALPGTS